MNRTYKILITFLMVFIIQGISFSTTNSTVNTENEIYKEYILTHNPKISNKDLTDIIKYVDKYSVKYDVPKILVYAMMKVESDFDKTTKSSANAIGVMQITRVLAKDYKLDRNSMENNIHMGVRYLKECINTFGLTNNAVAAYNRGIYGVKTKGYAGVKETLNHVRKVRLEIEYLNDKLK